MYCTVLLNSHSPGIGEGLTYSCPEGVQPGMLVHVPLRNKKVEGIVVSVQKELKDETFTPKPLKGIVGTEPLLTRLQLQTALWVAKKYWCSNAAALRPFLPASPWAKALPEPVEILMVQNALEKGGAKQMAVMNYLLAHTQAPLEEVRSKTGASLATIRSLVEKGHLEIVTEKKGAHAVSRYPQAREIPTLTEEQSAALKTITHSSKPTLLYGVTGSGKTEVYAHLIAEQAKKGKQSLLLLPEILLTQQLITRFESLFHPEHIAILHSRLTPAAKRAEWMRIRSGKAALVIGSRSALFAPVINVGAIIMDEEHEWTYKNEQTPRYHARDVAEYMATCAGATLVLGSATPSLEAWKKATDGHYTTAALPHRFNKHPMPTVRVIDLATVDFGSVYPFSPPLLDAITERLEKNEQSVLFLNRRGVATSVLCLECRKRLTSPLSQLPFTLHKGAHGNPYLQDHIGGVTVELPATCPYCNAAKLQPVGAGTQKVEEILRTLFPHARLLRADSDTLSSPDQMKKLLNTMKDGKADILLGTQSVVKGLDLPNVTLAAVLLADTGMSLPHFRAGERTFQLLTQLTGRSGRAKPGEVIIQTYRPQSAEVMAAAEHATTPYLTSELAVRQALAYPPCAELIRFTFKKDKPEIRARTLVQAIKKQIEKKALRATVLSAPTFFGGGKQWHVLLRGDGIRAILPTLDTEGATVDIDPIDVL